ncbi:DNA cytosine methyltransferase [Lutispora sp.]|uniref:DNA cytosine methyltransferase n=1 Tax=Lutispora sp. TaxID=2828727 RepID=UPI0035643A9D
MKKSYTIVSLFSGAGGMDMGFENQGYKILWANDIDKDACITHKIWSTADVVHGDISKLEFNNIPKPDVILGGFPCQGFSLAGPRKIDDKRNSLYRHFVKLVELKEPTAFVAENVKGILTLGSGAIIEAIIEDFKSKGYIVKAKLLNASDFGVPQDRERVILVGIKENCKLNFEFPEPLDHKVTIREALSSVEEPKIEDICNASYSSRYMSRNRRRDWDDTSYTIPAMAKQVPLHPSSPKMIKIHKDLWSFGSEGTTRRFSWQEAAAIQTFPLGMEFVGDLTSKYKQIGNAVPVKLAGAIAKALYSTLEKGENVICLDKSNSEKHLSMLA